MGSTVAFVRRGRLVPPVPPGLGAGVGGTAGGGARGAAEVEDVAEREAYVCAPPVLIDLARGWPSGLGLPDDRFHAESFSPPELDRPVDDGRRYTVSFQRSARSVEIDGATTLLEAAAQAGIAVPTGCERGQCRACVTSKLTGTVNLETGEAPLDRIHGVHRDGAI